MEAYASESKGEMTVEIFKSDESFEVLPCLSPAVKPSHADDKPITDEMIQAMEENGYLYGGQNEDGVYCFTEMPYQMSTFSLDVGYVPESSIICTVEGWADSVYMSITSTNGIITIPSNTYDEFVADYIRYGNCTLVDELPLGTTFKNIQIGWVLNTGYADTVVGIYQDQTNTVKLVGSSSSTAFPVTCTISADDDNAVSYWKTENDNTTQTDHTTKAITLTDKIEVFTYAIGEEGGQIYPQSMVFTVDVDETYLTNNAIAEVGDKVDKVKDSIDEQTEVIEENHEETKGLLGTIIEGITSLPSKIWEVVSDGLKALFIPEDGWLEQQFDNMKSNLEDSLGFLTFPFVLIEDFLNLFTQAADADDWTFTLPKLEFMNHTVWEEHHFDFEGTYSDIPWVVTLFDVLHLFIKFILIMALAQLGLKKYDLIVTGVSDA